MGQRKEEERSSFPFEGRKDQDGRGVEWDMKDKIFTSYGQRGSSSLTKSFQLRLYMKVKIMAYFFYYFNSTVYRFKVSSSLLGQEDIWAIPREPSFLPHLLGQLLWAFLQQLQDSFASWKEKCHWIMFMNRSQDSLSSWSLYPILKFVNHFILSSSTLFL